MAMQNSYRESHRHFDSVKINLPFRILKNNKTSPKQIKFLTVITQISIVHVEVSLHTSYTNLRIYSWKLLIWSHKLDSVILNQPLQIFEHEVREKLMTFNCNRHQTRPHITKGNTAQVFVTHQKTKADQIRRTFKTIYRKVVDVTFLFKHFYVLNSNIPKYPHPFLKLQAKQPDWINSLTIALTSRPNQSFNPLWLS